MRGLDLNMENMAMFEVFSETGNYKITLKCKEP